MSETKAALVTGAGKNRLGRHVAETLARRHYSLAVHYHTSRDDAERAVQELRALGVSAFSVQADLANETAVCGMMGRVVERFGRLDALVNCAAIWQRKRLEEITAADVRAHFEINALGTFLCAQQAGLLMIRQPEGGCIVNFGDWAVIRPYLDYAAYFPSKGAIPAITRSLAVELAMRNPRVRVNCLLPGPVMLPADLPAEERAQAIRATLVQREGAPEHVSHAVLFLLENEFVTGVCLPVDGGRSVYAPDRPNSVGCHEL